MCIYMYEFLYTVTYLQVRRDCALQLDRLNLRLRKEETSLQEAESKAAAANQARIQLQERLRHLESSNRDLLAQVEVGKAQLTQMMAQLVRTTGSTQGVSFFSVPSLHPSGPVQPPYSPTENSSPASTHPRSLR